VGKLRLGWVSFGPIVYGVCELNIRSLIVKKESLISPLASPPHLAMTRFFSGLTGTGQLERWAQNLTPAHLKWRVKRAGLTSRVHFAIPIQNHS